MLEKLEKKGKTCNWKLSYPVQRKDNQKLNFLYTLVGDIPISSWCPITWCDNRSAILSSCANLNVDCEKENYISKTENIYLVKKRVFMQVEQDVCYQWITRMLLNDKNGSFFSTEVIAHMVETASKPLQTYSHAHVRYGTYRFPQHVLC